MNEWTGANIVNESLTGIDVRADTLRGADILETSLGKVGNADKLDNLNSSHFVQGASADPGVFGFATAKTYFNRITNPSDSGTSTMLVVPGILHVEAQCTATAAELTVWSDVDGLDTFRVRDAEAADRNTLDIGFGLSTAATPTDPTRYLTIQAGLGANTFGLQDLVTITGFIARSPGSGECTFQASALAQQT